jgi:hypothetical protein
VSVSLGKHATVFQAEVFAILPGVYEIQTQDRPEKYVSICSDSVGALKALQAAKTSPLVRQCQKALNDISTGHTGGGCIGSLGTLGNCIGSLDMLGYEQMKSSTYSQGAVLFRSL